MKLFVEDNELLFDYSDADLNGGLDPSRINYERFLLATETVWDKTLKPKVKKYTYIYRAWQSEYGNARSLLSNIEKFCSLAKWNNIEIDDSVNLYINDLKEKCDRLRKIEEAKEEARKRIEKWKDVCKDGCTFCSNLSRWGDDYMCKESGDTLPEQPAPKYYGDIYYFCNTAPFPTENCPFNVNKIKGEC